MQKKLEKKEQIKAKTYPRTIKMNQELYLVIRLDFNSFLKCLEVLHCLISVSNEFHIVGTVIRMDRSGKNGSINTVIFFITRFAKFAKFNYFSSPLR